MQVFNPDFVAKVRAKRAGVPEPACVRATRNERRSAKIEATANRRDSAMPDWAKGIAKAVCQRHGVDLPLVASSCVTPRVVACRDEILWLLREDPRRPSLPRLGQWLFRDHSTIFTALKRYERRSEKLERAV